MAKAVDFKDDPEQLRREKEDFEQAARACITATVRLVWNMIRFPKGNQAIRKSADAWKQSLRIVLILRNSFVLTVLNKRLYFEDTPLGKADETVANFIDELARRRIRKVIFWRAANEHDLEHFATLMSTNPNTLLEEGGPMLLFKRLNIRNIGIIEAQQAQSGSGQGVSREYWQGKLDEVGLDAGEIIALLDGRGRLPRVITAEIMLLIDAMKNPKFLSQLLVRVAVGDSGRRTPEPAELLRICKRVQYLLIVNAGFDPGQTPLILSRAVETFDPTLRAGLLAEKLRVESQGTETVDGQIFAFHSDEYADYLIRNSQGDGAWRRAVAQLQFGPERAASIGHAYEARLLTATHMDLSPVEARNQARMLKTKLAPALPLPASGHTGPPPTPRLPRSEGMERLRGRVPAFTRELTEGYTYSILNLYAAAADGEWANDLFDRLIVIVEARLEVRRYDEVLSLLRAMFDPHLTATRLSVAKDRLRELLQKSYLAPLVDYVAQRISAGDSAVYDMVPIIIKVFGPQILDKVVDGLFRKATGQPEPAMIDFLERYASSLAPILSKYLNDPDLWVRVRAIEMLALFPAPEIRDLASKGLSDANRQVRLLSILAMGNGASDAGVDQLLKMANGQTRAGNQERCAAMYALGGLRCPKATPALKRIVARQSWVRRQHGYEIKTFAALALRRIASDDSLAILRKHLPELETTTLDRAVRWVKARTGLLWRWVAGAWGFVARVVGACAGAMVAISGKLIRLIVWMVSFLPGRPGRAAMELLPKLAAAAAKTRREAET